MEQPRLELILFLLELIRMLPRIRMAESFNVSHPWMLVWLVDVEVYTFTDANDTCGLLVCVEDNDVPTSSNTCAQAIR